MTVRRSRALTSRVLSPSLKAATQLAETTSTLPSMAVARLTARTSLLLAQTRTAVSVAIAAHLRSTKRDAPTVESTTANAGTDAPGQDHARPLTLILTAADQFN